MKKPSEKACFRIMDEMGMLDHIVRHSVMVRNVAVLLTDSLVQVGMDLDRELVIAAALLHDITKTRSFETGELHSETGGEYVTGLGMGRVAEIVRQHVMLDEYRFEGAVREAEIVNYADKRVLHDRIAGLDERMSYILERYGEAENRTEKIRWIWEQSAKLERKIFRFLPFAPEDIEGLV